MNTRDKFTVFALALCLSISGCSASNSAITSTKVERVQRSLAGGPAALKVTPKITNGGSTKKVQSVVRNHTKASINHLVLKVHTLNADGSTQPVLNDQGRPVEADLPATSLDEVVTFSNLRRNTTYRIFAFAYKLEGNDEANLMSTSDARSYTDIPVGEDDRPDVMPLQVRLIDVVFESEASGSVLVQDGGYTYNGPVSINVGAQSQLPGH